ncbi:MAG: putative oxidoreductase [Gemmatimonadetes bacterium]|nr:putative oxidoreductase [Gemmatimonadota bacterium]
MSAGLAACSRSDARPVAGATSTTANGAVTTMAGSAAPSDSVSASADRGRIQGAEGAQVWMIEVSDFQCPYCKSFHDDVAETIDREYVKTGKVRHAFINFPLTRIHPNARPAAEAAMCASAQGRFWQLHDGLFDTQPRWAGMPDATAHFDSLAVAAGVDAAAWRRCMSSHATAALIDADQERASRSGVGSTPSFFIGNRALVGAYPVDSFRVILDSAIAKARAAR